MYEIKVRMIRIMDDMSFPPIILSLLSGLFGSIITAACQVYFANRKEQRRKRAACLILQKEIISHKYYLLDYLDNPASLQYFKTYSTQHIEQLKLELVNLEPYHLKIILEHISAIENLHAVLQITNKPTGDWKQLIDKASKAIDCLNHYI